MGKFTISMAIFNSYVKLPEGTALDLTWNSSHWLAILLGIYQPPLRCSCFLRQRGQHTRDQCRKNPPPNWELDGESLFRWLFHGMGQNEFKNSGVFKHFKPWWAAESHVFFCVLNFKLVGGDWNHGLDSDFPFSNGKSAQLTFTHFIIFRGRHTPPTRYSMILPFFIGKPSISMSHLYHG